MVAGVLVCGGGSTRFGEADKVCAALAGKPLVRHVADAVAPLVDDLVVSCRAEQAEALETALEDCSLPVSFVFDAREDAGPLHGIERGLENTDAEFAVVVACDMPFVETTFLRTLLDRVREHEAAVPEESEGEWYQPLQAVYRVDPMLTAIATAREAGVSRPIKPALSLDAVTVSPEDVAATERTFFNVNTREDLDRAHEMRSDAAE
jgi:molybdopterin-guanine dinucleotide biosynthesis protein A